MKIGDIVVHNNIIGKVVETYGKKDEYRLLPCKYGRYYSEDLDVITDDVVRDATFDEKIAFIEEEFNWGIAVKTHCVGEYQFIESDTHKFHLYINFKNTCASYDNLDVALIGAVCYKNRDERASDYICKMLGI